MAKIAYHADYLYFDGELKEKSWLLTDGAVVTGVSNAAPEGYQRKSFQDSAIFPAFINTHTHVPMNFLRGYADDLPLDIWLNEHIWPAEKRLLSYEFVRDASELAAAELIRGGVACCNDMYFFPEATIEAFSKAGLRGIYGIAVMATKRSGKIFEKLENFIETNKDNPLVKLSICPHAVYTASPEVYALSVEMVNKYSLILHTHLSETTLEVENCIKQYGKTPVELMDQVGALDCPSIFAHCVHPSESDIELLGSKKTNVSHCLQSNMKLASGFAPVKQLLEAGVNVSIGTDGASSNNDLDMLSEIQTAALFHKAYNSDPTFLSAEQALRMATSDAAKAVNWSNIGSLKPGNQADFIVVSYDSPHMQPVFHPLSNLIYSARKNDITDMFVAGRQLMANRELTTIYEPALIAKSQNWAKKITN